MSLNALEESVRQTIEDLRSVQEFYANPNPELSESITEEMENACIESIRDLERALGCMDGRRYAESLLDRLNGLDSPIIQLHGIDVPFGIARMLAFQNYTTIIWALYDIICKGIGFWMCTWNHWKNNTTHFKLVQTVIVNVGKESSASDNVHLKYLYGLPMCVSYCIRNLFTHEVDMLASGNYIFETQDIALRFRPSQSTLDHIREYIGEKKVEEEYSRDADLLNSTRDCLMALLLKCNERLDEAIVHMLDQTRSKAKRQADLLAQ